MGSKHPECDKLLAVRDQSQIISEFMEWLTSEGIELCKWQESRSDREAFTPGGFYTVLESTEEILARYFGIDLNKVETEKRQMLDEIRKSVPNPRPRERSE